MLFFIPLKYNYSAVNISALIFFFNKTSGNIICGGIANLTVRSKGVQVQILPNNISVVYRTLFK